MIKINKAASEPFVFRTVKQKTKTYDDLHSDDKDSLKKVLIEEQFCLCAYCMERIQMNNSSIEHYFPRHPTIPDGTDKSLDYHNLLAVCVTSKNFPDKFKFCESKRKNTKLSINPMLQEHIDTIYYDRNGRIYSTNHVFEKDINETLNLNCDYLLRNRRAALSGTLRKMKAKKTGNWSKDYIANVIAHLESGTTRIPYIGYILFHLKKRQNRG